MSAGTELRDKRSYRPFVGRSSRWWSDEERVVGRSRYADEAAMVSRTQNGTSPPHSRGCSTTNDEVTSRWKHCQMRNSSRTARHLKLKGLQPKTIEAYSRAFLRIDARFEHRIDSL